MSWWSDKDKVYGSPYSCCAALGMIPKEQCNENCTKCWNTEVEEWKFATDL